MSQQQHPPGVDRTLQAPKSLRRHYDERPNVLWLMADQWRGDMLGFMGRHPALKTPNLDRLAARGVTFTRSYCNYPLCQPSRASMMTSRYIPKHGVWSNGHRMFEQQVCFPPLLRDAGYRTANIGKTHCGRSTTELFEFNQNSPDAFGATKPSDVAFDPKVYPECVFIADKICDNSDRVLYGKYPSRQFITDIKSGK